MVLVEEEKEVVLVVVLVVEEEEVVEKEAFQRKGRTSYTRSYTGYSCLARTEPIRWSSPSASRVVRVGSEARMTTNKVGGKSIKDGRMKGCVKSRIHPSIDPFPIPLPMGLRGDQPRTEPMPEKERR